MKIWKIDLKDYMQDISEELAIKVRDKLMYYISGGAYIKEKNPIKFINSVSISVSKDKLLIQLTDKAMYYQEVGTRPHKMIELVGRTVPMKDKATGRTIFRKVTVNSLRMGWHHPGIKAKNIVSNAVELVTAELKGEML